jgi:hypothetical protein
MGRGYQKSVFRAVVFSPNSRKRARTGWRLFARDALVASCRECRDLSHIDTDREVASAGLLANLRKVSGDDVQVQRTISGVGLNSAPSINQISEGVRTQLLRSVPLTFEIFLRTSSV